MGGGRAGTVPQGTLLSNAQSHQASIHPFQVFAEGKTEAERGHELACIHSNCQGLLFLSKHRVFCSGPNWAIVVGWERREVKAKQLGVLFGGT